MVGGTPASRSARVSGLVQSRLRRGETVRELSPDAAFPSFDPIGTYFIDALDGWPDAAFQGLEAAPGAGAGARWLVSADVASLSLRASAWLLALPGPADTICLPGVGPATPDPEELREAIAPGHPVDAAWSDWFAALPQDASRWPKLERRLADISEGADHLQVAALLESLLMGPPDDPRRGSWLLRLGAARRETALLPEARLALEEAFRASSGQAWLRARVLAEMALLAGSEGTPDLAESRFEEALEALASGEDSERARILLKWGRWRARAGDLPGAETLLLKAAEAARAAVDLAQESRARLDLAETFLAEGQVERAQWILADLREEAGSRMLSLGERAGIEIALAGALRELGRADASSGIALRSRLAAALSGDPATLAAATRAVVMARVDSGNPSRAAALLRRERTFLKEICPRELAALRLAVRTRIGGTASLRRALAAAIGDPARWKSGGAAAGWHATAIRAAREAGDRKDLSGSLEAASNQLQGAHPRSTEEWELSVESTAAHLVLGSGPEVKEEARRLAIRLEGTTLLRLRARLALARAGFAMREGDLGQVRTLLGETDAVLPAEGLPFERAVLAGLESRRFAQTGSMEESLALRSRAVELFRTAGAVSREESVIREMRASPVVPSSPPPAAGLLGGFFAALGGRDFDSLPARALDWLVQALGAEGGALVLADSFREGSLAEAAGKSQASQRALKRAREVASGTFAEPGGPADPLTSVALHFGRENLGAACLAGLHGEEPRALLRSLAGALASRFFEAFEWRSHVRRLEFLEQENRRLHEAAARPGEPPMLASDSPAMKALLAQARRIASGSSSVLILGEDGSGKSRLAEFIHRESARAGEPLVVLNCAALPHGLMEAEMFGIEPEGGSGAAARPGTFELAHRGTLFLDEIGDLDLSLQARLLRVLETGEIRRVGGRDVLRSDVRMISATHRNLKRMVQEGSFREDLYSRISLSILELPPLRERRAEIVGLAEQLLTELAAGMKVARPELTPAFREFLLARAWPGNIRELRNELTRAILLEPGRPLAPPAGWNAPSAAPSADLKGEVAGREVAVLREALEANRWNQSLTARQLGISEQAVRYKMRKHGIRRPLESSEGR